MPRTVAALWLLLGAAPLAAQMEPPVEVASRVRIRTLDSAGRTVRWMEGTVTSRSRDTILVRAAGGQTTVPYWVQPGKDLWVRAETRKNVHAGAIVGGVTLGLTGFIVGAVVGKDCSGGEEVCFSSEQITTIATGAGMLVGVTGGALVGRYLIRPRWVRSDRFSGGPRLSLSSRELGVRVAFAF